MSARLSATENLLRTAGLPATIAGSSITFCGWVKMLVNMGTYQTYFYWRDSVLNGSRAYFVADGGQTFILFDAGSNAAGLMSPMAIGTWYFVAFVFTSTGLLTSRLDTYYAAEDAASLTVGARDPWPLTVNVANADEFWLGAQEGGIRTWDGLFSKVRIWAAALSAAELLVEYRAPAPVRQTNLADYLPLRSGASAAVASLGTWTPTGTFTTDSEPSADLATAGMMAAA